MQHRKCLMFFLALWPGHARHRFVYPCVISKVRHDSSCSSSDLSEFFMYIVRIPLASEDHLCIFVNFYEAVTFSCSTHLNTGVCFIVGRAEWRAAKLRANVISTKIYTITYFCYY